MIEAKLLTTCALVFLAVILSSCTGNTSRSDFDNDCDYARAEYEEMQQSVRTYYALGTTGVAEIAVAERRVKRAKDAVQKACGEQVPNDMP